MATVECCDFESPIILGDTAAVITIVAGGPDDVDDILINAEGCGCGYVDDYRELYCDVEEGGDFPNARITDFEFTIDRIPANHELVIDAVERVVKLLKSGTNVQVGGLDVMSWHGVFEWIESAKGGCVRVCIDASTAATNPDTTVTVETHDREL